MEAWYPKCWGKIWYMVANFYVILNNLFSLSLSVLQKGLKDNFADVQVSVVDCPDLTKEPFTFPVKGKQFLQFTFFSPNLLLKWELLWRIILNYLQIKIIVPNCRLNRAEFLCCFLILSKFHFIPLWENIFLCTFVIFIGYIDIQ